MPQAHDPAGAARPDRRALLRETALWSAPAAFALVLLGAFGHVTFLAVVTGWLLSLIPAFWLARGRMIELEQIAAWIGALPGADQRWRGVEAGGPVSERLLWPLVELRRQITRQAETVTHHQRTLATLIEALPDPILLVDRDHIVIQSNGAARRSFDAPDRPVPLGRLLRDPGVLAAVTGALAGTTASGLSFSPTHDLSKRFSCRVEPVALGDQGTGALIAIREQTEQVMIERMRADFVANASHEIRTPLASIQGFIETLRGPAKHDPKARESFLEIMAEEAARMTRLVDDLLSLSRIEVAAHQPPQERCRPGEVLEQVVRRMAPLARAGRVELLAEIAAGLPAITGDPDQLQQLFENLIDNAVKYGGEGKQVTVRAEALAAAPADCGPLAGRACVRVTVADQGPGIAPEHLPRLTERFYRIDSARSRRMRGTGLGLAIAKHIVRRHQGHLAIASALGRGSSFAVLLPLPAA
ncbi:MAG: ATP-binding protein [Geminicoccaceae bacterium]